MLLADLALPAPARRGRSARGLLCWLLGLRAGPPPPCIRWQVGRAATSGHSSRFSPPATKQLRVFLSSPVQPSSVHPPDGWLESPHALCSGAANFLRAGVPRSSPLRGRHRDDGARAAATFRWSLLPPGLRRLLPPHRLPLRGLCPGFARPRPNEPPHASPASNYLPWALSGGAAFRFGPVLPMALVYGRDGNHASCRRWPRGSAPGRRQNPPAAPRRCLLAWSSARLQDLGRAVPNTSRDPPTSTRGRRPFPSPERVHLFGGEPRPAAVPQ